MQFDKSYVQSSVEDNKYIFCIKDAKPNMNKTYFDIIYILSTTNHSDSRATNVHSSRKQIKRNDKFKHAS